MDTVTILLAISILLNIILIRRIYKMSYVIRDLTPKYITKSYKRDKKLLGRTTDDIMSRLSGQEFENLCCEVLNATGYNNIRLTRATGDFGIDVLCEKDGAKYGIQCKCYSQPVGVHAIEEAYAGCAYYGCDVPVVMTNNYFTDAAHEMSRIIKVELRSKSYFAETINLLRKKGR